MILHSNTAQSAHSLSHPLHPLTNKVNCIMRSEICDVNHARTHVCVGLVASMQFAKESGVVGHLILTSTCDAHNNRALHHA